MRNLLSLRSGVGIISTYAIVASAIFLLQAFPRTGIFLMFAMGVLWIGLLIHVAMVHLTVASLNNLIPRKWIAVPIAYYGGGFALYLLALLLVNVQTAVIERANAAARIRAEQPLTFLMDGTVQDGTALLQGYRADRFFVRNRGREGEYFTTEYFAQGETCERANKGYFYEKRFEPWLRVADLFPSYKGPDKSRQCIIQQDRLPAQWRYRIKADGTRSNNVAVRSYGTKWTVFDGQRAEPLLTVEVRELFTVLPIPLLLAGCGLNSGAARWDCGATLMGSLFPTTAGYKGGLNTLTMNPPPPGSDVDTWQISALARALSLEARQPTD
jgi:hypothetical protein